MDVVNLPDSGFTVERNRNRKEILYLYYVFMYVIYLCYVKNIFEFKICVNITNP